MIEPVQGEGFTLRRASPDDAEFLESLATNEEISPFLAAVSPRDADGFLEEIERSAAAPYDSGRYVIDVEDGGTWWAAGSVAFMLANRRSRIAVLHGLMLRPDARGRGIALGATKLFTRHLLQDLNYHRVELECYGFNERAIHHFERAGYIREGVKRKAYWRRGEWVDGVLFALVREDLEA